jgi:hypothetical protein
MDFQNVNHYMHHLHTLSMARLNLEEKRVQSHIDLLQHYLELDCAKFKELYSSHDTGRVLALRILKERITDKKYKIRRCEKFKEVCCEYIKSREEDLDGFSASL